MIWLQSPQWIRWTLAILVALAALWTEFRGDGIIEHPFATEIIASGEAINSGNTQLRPVPAGLLEPVTGGGFADRAFFPGEPITGAGVTDRPKNAGAGWWALEIDIPKGANLGDAVQLVLLDSGLVVPGTVSALADEDPLSSGSGSVAVPPEHASAAAEASANGRVVALVSAG